MKKRGENAVKIGQLKMKKYGKEYSKRRAVVSTYFNALK